jgi:2-polyprenyl-6-hydroxyphenyl methylase/3-demethylubiquinone-9 3-methyltransferase
MREQHSSTVDPKEVERFARFSAQWWDPRGPMAMLHKLNPVRIAYIRDRVTAHFGRDLKKIGCLVGLRILDIGCGGGLLSEPLARLGATVVGVDPAEANVEAARKHAAQTDLAIDYRAANAETLAEAGERFDVVLALEVVEHVADLEAFLSCCARMLKPNGVLIVATINRTVKSFALAIVGAEYVMRWLPRGTHQWSKFVTPAELDAAAQRAGLRVIDESGAVYNIVRDVWQLAPDMDVNYIVTATRAA